MKKIKKISLLILIITMSAMFLPACSGETQIESDGGITEEEILNKYNSIAQDSYENSPINSGASVLGENFSAVDFTFTSQDNTIAYSIDTNSFAKILPGGTFFASLAPGSEVETFDAGFKTARGLSLENTLAEYMASYGINATNSLYLNPNDSIYYQPSSSNINGKLTCVYASNDNVSYLPLSYTDVQNFLYQRSAFAQGSFVSPEKIMEVFPDYTSLVSIDITSDVTGCVSEVVFSRFDK